MSPLGQRVWGDGQSLHSPGGPRLSLSNEAPKAVTAQMVAVSQMPFKEALRAQVRGPSGGLSWRQDLGLPVYPGLLLVVGFSLRTTGARLAYLESSFDWGDGQTRDRLPFELGPKWQRVTRVVLARQTSTNGVMCFRFSGQAGGLEWGGFSARLAQPGEVPNPTVQALRVPGGETNAPWRKDALERIEALRKDDIEIALVGPDGKPLSNVAVTLFQEQSAFVWGTNLSNGTNLTGPLDRQNGILVGGRMVGAQMGAPLMAVERFLEKLELESRLGFPLVVSGFEVPTLDEKGQSNALESFVTAAFSHPGVGAFCLAGFAAHHHPSPTAALLRPDGSLKPAALAWQALTQDTWMTRVSGSTDTGGRFKVRGYLGKYRLTLATAQGAETHRFHLEKGGLSLVLPFKSPGL